VVPNPVRRVGFPIDVDSEDIENCSSEDSLMVEVSILLSGGGVTGRCNDDGDWDFMRRGRFRRGEVSVVVETSMLDVDRVFIFSLGSFCTPASIGFSKEFSLLM
jgi:hypothetical protein